MKTNEIISHEEFMENMYKPNRVKQFMYRISNKFYYIKCFFFPQHQELRKVIPKTWYDIDGIMENFIFACFLSWADGEDGLNHWDWVENDTEAVEAKFKEIYEYAKVRTWESPELTPELENEYLLYLVENRGVMWT
jgi:hypothetical protein